MVCLLIGIFVIAIHYAISYYFLKNPLVIKKKKIPKNTLLKKVLKKDKFLGVVHRGGCLYNLENTMEAFQFAVKTGCDVLELDVFLTKDKKLVVFHDLELTRIFGKDILTSEANHEDFNNPAESIPMHFHKGGSFKTSGKKFPSPVSPTLEEVLLAFPKMNFSVEIKDLSTEARAEFCRIIRKLKAQDRVIAGITKGDGMKLLRKELPDMSTFTTVVEAMTLLISFILGALPYIDIGADALMLPYFTKDFEEWELAEPYTKNSTITILMYRIFRLCYAPITIHLKMRGYVSLPWVVNTENDFEVIRHGGSLGVITDDPILVREYIRKHRLNVNDD